MQILLAVVVTLVAYFVGSIPFGLLIVKLKTGKDILTVESGRTGGTNALRAAGLWAGLGTALLDILKSAATVWMAQAVAPQQQFLHVLAPIAAIIGHNYSIFLPERDENGRIVRLRGGAGGAPSIGGALGLWAPSALIILPLGALVFFTLGYASITTMSVALFATIVFAVRAAQGMPWADVLYGLAAEVLLIWALRPNIRKLLEGNERVVGISLHGRIKARKERESAAEAVRDMD
ncbi:MAG: glycerol-3-phosphate acyltransferase [Bacteroidota bacterium]